MDGFNNVVLLGFEEDELLELMRSFPEISFSSFPSDAYLLNAISSSVPRPSCLLAIRHGKGLYKRTKARCRLDEGSFDLAIMAFIYHWLQPMAVIYFAPELKDLCLGGCAAKNGQLDLIHFITAFLALPDFGFDENYSLGKYPTVLDECMPGISHNGNFFAAAADLPREMPKHCEKLAECPLRRDEEDGRCLRPDARPRLTKSGTAISFGKSDSVRIDLKWTVPIPRRVPKLENPVPESWRKRKKAIERALKQIPFQSNPSNVCATVSLIEHTSCGLGLDAEQVDLPGKLMELGVVAPLSSPEQFAYLKTTLFSAMRRGQGEATHERLLRMSKARRKGFPLIGKSAPMLQLYSDILDVLSAPDFMRQHVLIVGETGTGKELVAQVIRDLAPGDGLNFKELNCAMLDGATVESRLFGHKKGAFTGAVNDQPGLIEEAEGGILFLDEVNSLPDAVMVKLLKFMEDGKASMLGDVKEKAYSIKIVAATNDLDYDRRDALKRRGFITRFSKIVRTPPLRFIPEDVKAIVEKYARKYRNSYYPSSKKGAELPEWLVNDFENLMWKNSNIRGLRTVIESAVAAKLGSAPSLRSYGSRKAEAGKAKAKGRGNALGDLELERELEAASAPGEEGGLPGIHYRSYVALANRVNRVKSPELRQKLKAILSLKFMKRNRPPGA